VGRNGLVTLDVGTAVGIVGGYRGSRIELMSTDDGQRAVSRITKERRDCCRDFLKSRQTPSEVFWDFFDLDASTVVPPPSFPFTPAMRRGSARKVTSVYPPMLSIGVVR